MVAGLEEISEGSIRVGDRVVNDLEPSERDIAMVFQNYALYPHMTVFDNIAFPLRSRRLPRSEIRRRVERGAGARPRRAPEAQAEEALGRPAPARRDGARDRPRAQVFLMDEPLSNLDAKLRMQMRAEISRLQLELGVTTIYVTHDQVEAMTMGTKIGSHAQGHPPAAGPAQQMYDEPVDLFVATFIGSPGMNLLRGQIVQWADRLACRIGTRELPSAHAHFPTPDSRPPRRDVAVGIRPEHLKGHWETGTRPSG